MRLTCIRSSGTTRSAILGGTGSSISLAAVFSFLLSLVPVFELMAQDPNGPPATYLEVMDLAGNVPENRVTRDLTRTRLARDLFTLVGSQVVWAYTANSGAEAVYQFATDPAWDRIVYSKRNSDWINAFGERGTGVFQFDQPLGIDVDMDLNVYVADFGNRRLVVLGFADERLYWQFAFGEDSWHPLDILWDNNGTVGDNADDYLWILHHRVEKLIERRQVDVNTYTVGPPEIEYGGWGSGEGRFLNPSTTVSVLPAEGGIAAASMSLIEETGGSFGSSDRRPLNSTGRSRGTTLIGTQRRARSTTTATST